MSINIGPPSSEELRPRITVIGIGGAGGNAIANMIEAEVEGVDFVVANTDAQALAMSNADVKIQLGPDITGGLGAGARPEVGKAAAEETVQEIEDALEGVNMVFIAAGMGGGTGTGAAPVIAEAARRKGVLTVGVVTKPFLFEGTRRMRAAEAGIDELQKHVDTLIVIPNQNLFLIAKAETTFKEAFQLADEVLQQGVSSITDLMVMPGLINLDFADVRSVMSEMGKAMMGTGEGEGESRALEAAERAIANPLLDGVSMQGAKGVIISIIGGEDMKLLEVDEAANHIRELVDEDANIIWGSAFNPDLDGKIRVSVVATGIDQNAVQASTDHAPINLGAARAPKRPVIELPSVDEEAIEEVADEEPLELQVESFAEPEAEEETAVEAEEQAPVATEPDLDDEPPVEPFDLTGMQVGDDMGESEEDDDVDGIVDPLAGMRNEDNDPYADNFGADDGADTLDLTDEVSEPEAAAPTPSQTEVGEGRSFDGPAEGAGSSTEQSDAFGGDGAGGDHGGDGGQVDAGSQSGSGGGAAGDGSAPEPSGGTTLFERMANLSRGAGSSEDEEEDEDGDDGGSSLSIPRFLGRQNNQ